MKNRRQMVCWMVVVAVGLVGCSDQDEKLAAENAELQQQIAELKKQPSPPAIDIWKASAEGHLEVVKQHLAGGANIDTPFVVPGLPGSGGSPLHLAAIFNQPEIAAYLIKEGANLENLAQDEHGGPALHWAAFAGNVEVIKLLLEAGAKINATDKNGATAIDAAVVGQKIEAGGFLKQNGGQSGSEL